VHATGVQSPVLQENKINGPSCTYKKKVTEDILAKNATCIISAKIKCFGTH
jgi:hypothetical protein